ncbi:MAG: methylmalonyl-CoA mutase family protein [Corynebacteriales bacterium]|nr:methylmalonyl-CoA mutase family protein [Mycobacteriales bacterium]
MVQSSGDQASSTADAPDAARAAWEQAVAGVLAKARRVDPSEITQPASALLATTTYDDILVDPLYDPSTETPEPTLPGRFPFVRGRDAARDVTRGWHVTAVYGGAGTDPAEVNTAILDGLTTGVSALWWSPSTDDPAADLTRALDGVLLDLAPLTVRAGADTAAVGSALFALLDARPDGADPTTTHIGLGADPLTARFVGTDAASVPDTLSLAAAAAARAEPIRAICVDGTVFHDAGASEAQEIGAAVAAGIEYLRLATESGMTVADALDQISFRIAATDAQFETIAKFRAARRVWARVAQVVGAPEHGGAPQHGVTSSAMMTQRDPWVNLLRTTLGAFGAGVGGADQVTVLPFDAALPPDALGVSRTFAERMARNTQLLLLEESHLGRVLDPAAGSWFVEDLTDRMAQAAWEVLQRIDAAGGYTAALDSGSLAEEIAATRARRDDDIAHRLFAVTGVTEFPNLAEKPLPADRVAPTAARYGEAFEQLRDRSDAHLAATGERPSVFLAPLGTVAENNARTTFAANLMAAGGIAAMDPGPTDDLAEAARSAGATVAVVCGTDKRYATEALDAIASLRSAGVTRVLLAGPRQALAGTAAADDESLGPDGHLTLGVDAVAVLTDLLDMLTSQGAPA